MGRLIHRLKERSPTTTVVAYQDDTYLVDTMQGIVDALASVRTLWAELGLKINDVKLKLYTAEASTRANAPSDLKARFVDSLPMLGQRLAVKLEENGVDFNLTPGGGGLPLSLAKAHDQLRQLAARLRQVVAAGLSIGIAHKIWAYASGGAIAHLQSADFCDVGSMTCFQNLQLEHVKWITGREPSEKDMEVAFLPQRDGGMGLPDYKLQAATNYLSAQSRVLPKVCAALSAQTVEELVHARPKLERTLGLAKAQAIEQGAPSRKVPQPSSAAVEGSSRRKAKVCTRAMQKLSREKVEAQLGVPQRARLNGQGRRGASLWLQNPLPEGEPPANETWSAMIRHRLLMPGPGAPIAPSEPRQCAHVSQQGRRCLSSMDSDGVHECLCNLGGGPLTRHNRVREWLADKLRESFGGKTLTEQPHPLANSRGMGRMDIKHDSAFGHLDIDVTIPSIYTSNVREALRRQQAPERAIRGGVADKLTTYGPGVIAFAVDDAGAVGAGALRLLRRLAWQSGGESEGPSLLLRWRAELQHIVLQATAGMAQSARGVPRTA